MQSIFTNRTSDGQSNTVKRNWSVSNDEIPYASQTVYVWGNFNGASVSLQVSHDGVEWFTPTNATFTTKSVANVNVSCLFVRGSVVNAGEATSINMVLL